MDHTSLAGFILAGCAASAALVYYKCVRAPEGYQDGEGFHYGPTPNPVPTLALVQPAALDWSKPLELSDGTPVRLQTVEEVRDWFGGTNPDRDGDYWITGDGVELPSSVCKCVSPGGRAGAILTVRNRAEAQPAPIAANENIPQLTVVQRKVLDEMHDCISYPAETIAARTKLHRRVVTKARRELAGMGLLEYGMLRGDGGEDHRVAGRGYWLTREGERVQQALRDGCGVAA